MTLLRAGLWDREPETQPFVGLTPDGWTEIYGMARRQTVTGICYSALCRLPDELLPPAGLLMRWVARVNAIEKNNAQMARSLRRLLDLLQAEGLHPVVQKGISVGRHYKAPSLREAGDIDLWFPEEELARVVRLARGWGKDVKSHPDRSYSMIFDGFVIEIHRKLINLGNPSAARSLAVLIKSEPVIEADTEAGPIPALSPLLEMLLINVHIMRHSFGMGVGMRQICDYAMAAAALRGHYSEAEFVQACHRFGIERWTSMLNRFVVSYLDTPSELLPASGFDGHKPGSPERLIDIVKEGGNFGHYLPPKRSMLGRAAQSKLHTLAVIIKRSRFAASMAPKEAIWSFLRLLLGQVH